MEFPFSDAEVKNVDAAVLSAFEVVRDFSESDIGKRLTPKQLLAAVTIAAVERANRMGLSGQSVSATLRDLADGVESL
ncbi:hypothetical protein H0I76_01460 [Limibaculum sp. M0105]|uniref:Uncharacterized protein n=1 Tax=Thermohalobaculum xanthum TaxID=2753746 RepID=A0A8J7M443_9RHOB|nr:hypothetical protein [Thermohalobaculum xanthum]MBK0397844.1 hypothetical protein [Thermohalobaculum xanthum]